MVVLPGILMKYKLLTDNVRRFTAAKHELDRLALRHIIRSPELPSRTRLMAQFQLNDHGAAHNPHTLARRCIISGRGRSVVGQFNIGRHEFRRMALAGQLVGVGKACW